MLANFPVLNKNCFSLLPALFLFAVITQAGAAALPFNAHFSADFTVSKNGLTIGQTLWKSRPLSKQLYRFTASTRATGFASLLYSGERLEESTWRNNAGRPQSLSYRYQDSEKSRKNLDLQISWDEGTVTSSSAKGTLHFPLKPETHDKLSYLLAMRTDLLSRVQPSQYLIGKRKGIKSYPVSNTGTERLKTAIGTFTTTRLVRQGKRQTTIWFARELGYFPVKVQHREKDGETLLMEIKKLSQ